MAVMNPPASRPSGGQTQPTSTAARTGTINQGAASGATATSAAPGNANHTPRYANAILSMLNPPSAAADQDTGEFMEKSKRCGQLLDRLVPPLFCQLTNNASDVRSTDVDTGDEQDQEARESKKRKMEDSSDQPDEAKKDEHLNIFESSQSNEDRLASLQRQLEQYKLQNQRIFERRMSVYNSLVELHECYETGLDGIARATDLRNVPDNVMMDRPSDQ
jgi:hypothetical protein